MNDRVTLDGMFKACMLVIALAPAVAYADKDLSTPEDGTTWDCGTDPKVNVNYAEGSFTFTGTCEEVNVNGAKVTVKAENVDTLNVNGDKNKISTLILGAVNINGTSNKVTYKKAKTGKKPKVAAVGKGNGVTKVK